jgi:hypothetical protein
MLSPRHQVDAVALRTENHAFRFGFILPLAISLAMEPSRPDFHQGIDQLRTVGTDHGLKGRRLATIHPSIDLGLIAAVGTDKIMEYFHSFIITKQMPAAIIENPEFPGGESWILRAEAEWYTRQLW